MLTQPWPDQEYLPASQVTGPSHPGKARPAEAEGQISAHYNLCHYHPVQWNTYLKTHTLKLISLSYNMQRVVFGGIPSRKTETPFSSSPLYIFPPLLKIVKPRPKSQTPKAQPQPSQIQSKSVPKGLGLTLKSFINRINYHNNFDLESFIKTHNIGISTLCCQTLPHFPHLRPFVIVGNPCHWFL